MENDDFLEAIDKRLRSYNMMDVLDSLKLPTFYYNFIFSVYTLLYSFGGFKTRGLTAAVALLAVFINASGVYTLKWYSLFTACVSFLLVLTAGIPAVTGFFLGIHVLLLCSYIAAVVPPIQPAGEFILTKILVL